MDVTAHQTNDIDELQRRIRNTTNAKQRDRYRVILLAIRGLTTPQIMDKLNVSRSVAGGLIEKAALEMDRKEGRTEFFTSNGASKTEAEPPELPAAVAAAAVAGDDILEEEEEDDIAALDAEIVDTRNALQSAAAKAGKALGEWATHDALVSALKERMTDLATKRMNASS